MARYQKKINPDEGQKEFTVENLATEKAIIVRWDSWLGHPVASLGEVTPHEAYGWLVTVVESLDEMLSERSADITFD